MKRTEKEFYCPNGQHQRCGMCIETSIPSAPKHQRCERCIKDSCKRKYENCPNYSIEI